MRRCVLTLGSWLASRNKTPEQLLGDGFEIGRAARELLKDKGIEQPTGHQLHETRFAIAEAVKAGKWQDFVTPVRPGIIDAELSEDCCPGIAFFERDAYSTAELEPAALRMRPHLARKLDGAFSSAVTGQILAATFVGRAQRCSLDFSHAYGEDAWHAHLRAHAMLEAIPKGQLLERLDLGLLCETNRLAHAEDPRTSARAYRAIGALTRGRWDVPGRIRESRTLTQPYALDPEEVKNLESVGVFYYPMPGTGYGVIEYPAPEGLPDKLRAEIETLKAELSKDDPDVIGAAAAFCRNLVALHAFEDCNGRTARLLLNRVLREYDLPPAILSRPDEDLTRSAADWRQEVLEGIAHTKRYLERKSPFAADAYLSGEGLQAVPDAADRPTVRLDGLPFRVGTDGFLYDPTGRPHLVKGGDTVVPLAQMEHYLLARRLLAMPEAAGRAELAALTASTVALGRRVADEPDQGGSVRVVCDASARAADADFTVRAEPFVLEQLSLLSDVKAMDPARRFSVSGARGTARSSLLSRYAQTDLELWHAERAASGRQRQTLHAQRAELFEVAKQTLDALPPAAHRYEARMYEVSPLRHASLAEAIAKDGDDTTAVWRGDYGVADVLGMAPNNDPRQTDAKHHARAKFESGAVFHLLQSLKRLEQSGVGSRYLSHTTDLSLLCGKFTGKKKKKVVDLSALPGVVASGLAQGLGYRSDLTVKDTDGRLEIEASRRVFEMRLPKASLLPGLVAASSKHPFAHEQEVHGLESVSPWSFDLVMEPAELMQAA